MEKEKHRRQPIEPGAESGKIHNAGNAGKHPASEAPSDTDMEKTSSTQAKQGGPAPEADVDLDLSIDEILADVHARRELFNPENRFIPPAVFEDALSRPSSGGDNSKTKKPESEQEQEQLQKEGRKASAVIREPSPRRPAVPPAIKVEPSEKNAAKGNRDTVKKEAEQKPAKRGLFSRRKKRQEESLPTDDPYYGLKLKSIEEYRRQYQETMAFPKIKPTTDSPFSYLYTEGEGENPSVLSNESRTLPARNADISASLSGESAPVKPVSDTTHSHATPSHSHERAAEQEHEHRHGHRREKHRRTPPEEIFSFSSETLREQAAEENRLPAPEEFPPELVKELSADSSSSIAGSTATAKNKPGAEAPVIPADPIESLLEESPLPTPAEKAETQARKTGENQPVPIAKQEEAEPAVNFQVAQESEEADTPQPGMKAAPAEEKKENESQETAANVEPVSAQETAPCTVQPSEGTETGAPRMPEPESPQKPSAPTPSEPTAPSIPSIPAEPVSPAPVDFPAGPGPEMPAMPAPGAGSVIRGEEAGKPAPIKEPTSPQPGTEPQEASPPREEPQLPEAPLQPRILRLETRRSAPTSVSYSQEEAAGHEERGEEARQSSEEAGNAEGASFLHAVDLNTPELKEIFRREVENYLHPASHANDSKTPEAEDISSQQAQTLPQVKEANTISKEQEAEAGQNASSDNLPTETDTGAAAPAYISNRADAEKPGRKSPERAEFSTKNEQTVENTHTLPSEEAVIKTPEKENGETQPSQESSAEKKARKEDDSKGVPADAFFPFIQPVDPRTREDMPSHPEMRMRSSQGRKSGKTGSGKSNARSKASSDENFASEEKIQKSKKPSRAERKAARKKAKEEAFRMMGTDEPENRPEEDFERVSREQNSVPVLDDYTCREDEPAIRSYLNKTHHTLLIRLMATGLMALVVIFLEIFGGPLFGEGFPAVLRAVFCIFFLLISALFCGKVMKNGLRGLFTLKANGDSGAALGAAAALIQGLVLLFFPGRLEASGAEGLNTYCSLAALGLFLNSAGKLLLLRRMRHNFDFLAEPFPKYGVKRVEDVNTAMQMAQNCVPGVPVAAYQRKASFLHHFLRHSEDVDPADLTAQTLSPVGFLSSLLLGGAAFYLTRDFAGALTAFAAGCCVWIPIMNLLAVQLPLSRVSKLGKRCGAILTGYTALDTFSGVNAVVVDSGDIFPPSTIVLNGIRTFGDQRIDGAILDATALTKAVGGSLSDLFGQVIRSQEKILPKAENILYEDGLGILGWVNGRRTLVGNREMLERHGIEPPSKDYEKKYLTGERNLIYLASGGELVAMFLVTYTTSARVTEELQRLEDHGVSILVRTCDPNITPALLAERFDLDEESIRILPDSVGEPYYRMLQEPDPEGEATLATKGKFTSMARMLVACIRQRGNISMGTALQAVAVILGFVLTTFLVCCSAVSQLTPGALLLYELFWALAICIVPALRQG